MSYLKYFNILYYNNIYINDILNVFLKYIEFLHLNTFS